MGSCFTDQPYCAASPQASHRAKPGPRSFGQQEFRTNGRERLRWVVVFLVVALIAGVLGFTGIAVAAVAKLLFVFFLVRFSFHCLPSSRAEEAESSGRWNV